MKKIMMMTVLLVTVLSSFCFAADRVPLNVSAAVQNTAYNMVINNAGGSKYAAFNTHDTLVYKCTAPNTGVAEYFAKFQEVDGGVYYLVSPSQQLISSYIVSTSRETVIAAGLAQMVCAARQIPEGNPDDSLEQVEDTGRFSMEANGKVYLFCCAKIPNTKYFAGYVYVED